MKPSLKKPGDFTVAEGHEHPLIELIETTINKQEFKNNDHMMTNSTTSKSL